MIKPMVVELEVDANLGDEFYYYCFFYSEKELGFTKSYMQLFWKKLQMGVGFENTCIFLGKWNVSRFVTRLYGWEHKILRLLPLLVQVRFPIRETFTQQGPNHWL